MAVRSKPLEYAITMDADGHVAIPGGTDLDTSPDWTPEHLLLAALVRCTVASLEFHAARAEVGVSAGAAAHAHVTRRAFDGRHAVTSTDVMVEVTIEPLPAPDALARLLAKAERDCFVGASLASPPRYRWTVNGIAQTAPP
jgi:organic hydroperoxide reductase OsmC/OhrA